MTSRSFSIIIIFLALSLVGCALLPLLPVKLAPSRNLPSITVSFSMQGNAARTVESEVTSRIESALARINGVKGINSKSSNGSGRVSIDLDKHADIDIVRFEVSTIIRQIWDELPEGVSYPSITARAVEKESSRPFMTFRLNAPANPSEIQAYGEDNLKPVLARIPGVYKIELSGAQPMEWQLHYDMNQLSSLGLTPSRLRQAIREHYSSEFLGIAPQSDIDGSSVYIRLALHGGSSSDNFNPSDISVPLGNGSYISLDKLVKVTHTESSPKSHFRINGLNSIYVNITSEEDANQLALADKIRETIDLFAASMPTGYMIDNAYDATENIREELDKIYFRTGLTILILLLFVGIISLNIRYVLLITIGLFINLAVAIGFYYLTGIEIQLYSLAGITISLNLVIDNLIVMTDHYTRRHNRLAFTAILAATLTTIGALSIVYFMNEKTRLSLEDFVTVVIINLTVSLAVALFLVPALVDRLGIGNNVPSRKYRGLRRRVSLLLSRIYSVIIRFIVRFRVAVIIIVILAFGLPVFMIPDKIDGEGYWIEKYNSIFGNRIYKEKIKPKSDLILGGTLRLFVEKVYNGSYWDRDNGEPVLQITATLPNGATLAQMDALVRKMEAFLSGFPEIRQFQTSVSGPRRASISVMFNKEHQHDGFPYQLKGEVISKALTLGGGSWGVYGLEDQGFSNDVRESAGNYRVRLTGYN
ncbi:MAG: efflux RND transporter permease subunit, partial [Duncaniella sp.]|nr:efflux RND transporter permease subunit [Duncaniella sp.]